MLNFVKIELRGFKSFADRVEIPFNEGVTAIIGPNGCGKSNVSDAIRWTLGERSAKQLRGKSMQDVIFAGTEKRKSMSYCEVSLTFNNEGQRLFPSIIFDEVIITRKLDRSGSSEYFLNNNHVNLSEIISLLRDTGIGKEGYSIIGQGRVEEIMSVKPDERRHIFEEAAGISKQRADRREAERKLEATDLNLQTANKVIDEIEKQIAPLRRQAEAAQKYIDLKEQLKYNEINLYIYDYENSQAVKSRINAKIEDLKKRLDSINAQYEACDKRYAQCWTQSINIDSEYDGKSSQLTALKVDEEAHKGDAKVLLERITNVKNEIKRLSEEVDSIDNQLITSARLIESEKDKKADLVSQSIKAGQEFEELDARYQKLVNTLEGHETAAEERNQAYLRLLDELGEHKAKSASYETEKKINEERVKALGALLSQKKASLDEELTNLSIYSGKVSAAKERSVQLTSEYNEALSDKMSAKEDIKAYEEDLAKMNKTLIAAEGNLQFYIKSKEDYQGFNPSVGGLMNEAKHNDVVRSKILGVVAEVIKVPKDFEAAIEYTLGNNLQNVLVRDERDAGDLIAFLKQHNLGRVTFRPQTSCKLHYLTDEEQRALKEPGCLGLASDLVSCSPEFDVFVKALLGSTFVVNNTDNAIRIYNKYNRAFKIVTLDGDVFTRSGEITGGSRRNQTKGLLTREAQIEQATAQVEKIKSNIANHEELRIEKETEIAVLDERIAELNKEMTELHIELRINQESAGKAQENVTALQAEVDETAAEYELIKAQIKELAEQLDYVEQLERTAAEKKAEFSTKIEVSKSESSKQANERQALMEQRSAANYKKLELKNSIIACDTALHRFEREKSELEQEKIDKIGELRRAENRLKEIEEAPEKKTFTKEDAERIKTLEEELATLSARKRTIADELAELNESKTKISDERIEVSNQLTSNISKLENVDIEIQNEQQHILAEYDLTYNGALEYKDEEFKAYGAHTVISDLRKAIYRLGDVNLLAAQSLKETEERLAEQVTRRDDLQLSCEQLRNIMQIVTEEMQSKFSTAFEQINANFKEVFTQLFGGGKGELRLDTKETTDVLEAGIEIFAQPPGKKLQSIGLLSGGEKALTAIAILFAILRLKPMPFCVLDEIEAALDDANVNLFAEFLKKFSDYTQFIVITHRKPTMQHADTIFGVTMEEKGVTKIVSVEMEQAVKYAK